MKPNPAVKRDCTKARSPLLLRFADASRPRNGAADCNPLVAWRFAPHNHADQADIGRQSLRLFRPRGLSAAPFGRKSEIDSANDFNVLWHPHPDVLLRQRQAPCTEYIVLFNELWSSQERKSPPTPLFQRGVPRQRQGGFSSTVHASTTQSSDSRSLS